MMPPNGFIVGLLIIFLPLMASGKHISDVVQLACQRDPTLGICRNNPSGFDSVISSEDDIPSKNESTDGKAPVEKSKKYFGSLAQPSEDNIKSDEDNVMRSSSTAPNKTEQQKPSSSSISKNVVDRSQLMRLRAASNTLKEYDKNPFMMTDRDLAKRSDEMERKKRAYCHKYVPKFTFYCQGSGRFIIAKEDEARFSSFCFSVKETCIPEQSTPCTPDCDDKMHPHCTKSCKCDYLYPLIVKFCSPVAVPYLKSVCRSWFVGCAKLYALDTVDIETFLNPQITMSNKSSRKELLIKNKAEHFGTLSTRRSKAFQAKTTSGDSKLGSGNFHEFDQFTDENGIQPTARSRSPWVKPGLWTANPDDPHNRDHANKWYYAPRSVTADWLSGQVFWGAHWAVPAAGVGGTDGFSAVHFPSIGNFLQIEDDYD